MRLVILFFIILLMAVQTLAQEPSGGVITDLVYFDDTWNAKARIHPYNTAYFDVDKSVKKNGSASYKIVAQLGTGFQATWHGIANDGDWHGPDTSVFWAQSNSRLQMWVMYSVQETEKLSIQASDTYGGMSGMIYQQPIPQANTWYLIDAPIPSSMRNIPLKTLIVHFGGRPGTIWLDNFKVTNVRLYAGKGAPPIANMEFIGATQLGFPPNMKKQFTSPVEFSSFLVKRVSDNAAVFTGGAPVRSVPDVQRVINGATVWIGDFSSLRTPGRYKIVLGKKESYQFDIRADVYDHALRAAQRFFYYQRAFTAIKQPYAEGPWVHASDADKAPLGVVKGWHDAGDLTIYNATMTQAIYWLLEAWSDFKPADDNTNIPESGNGVPDLLDETRWGLEWLLSMQDANGGFWSTAVAERGTNTYRYASTTPNTVAPYVKAVPPCTQATAKAVAVLGYAAGVYLKFDAAFAKRCLDAAQRGWKWMVANPNQTTDGGGAPPLYNSYTQGNDQGLLNSNKMWAAAGMLYATGEAQYEAAFQSFYIPTGWISSYTKSEGFAASLYLKVPSGATEAKKNEIRQSIFQMADGVRGDANNHPFQVATHYYWGCTGNAMHRSGQFSWRAYMLDTTRRADCDQGFANLEYLFGRNFLNQVYVSGIKGVSKPRLGGFHHWLKALNANPYHFPGALAGGPNQAPDGYDNSYPNHTPYPVWGYRGDPGNPRDNSTPMEGRFTDNDSWSTNEVCVNWNAALVYNLYAARMIARGGSLAARPGR